MGLGSCAIFIWRTLNLRQFIEFASCLMCLRCKLVVMTGYGFFSSEKTLILNQFKGKLVIKSIQRFNNANNVQLKVSSTFALNLTLNIQWNTQNRLRSEKLVFPHTFFIWTCVFTFPSSACDITYSTMCGNSTADSYFPTE